MDNKIILEYCFAACFMWQAACQALFNIVLAYDGRITEFTDNRFYTVL